MYVAARSLKRVRAVRRVSAKHKHGTRDSRRDTLKTFTFDAEARRIDDIASNKTLVALSGIAATPAPELLGVTRTGNAVTAFFDTPEHRPDPPGDFAHHVEAWRGLARRKMRTLSSSVAAPQRAAPTATGGYPTKTAFS